MGTDGPDQVRGAGTQRQHLDHPEAEQRISRYTSRWKPAKLGKKYNVPFRCSYDEYDACLCSGEVDAAHIALPNSLHREYTVRACRARVHVLCEKPMAVTESDCEAMITAAKENRTRLMIAYRLHFEEANMKASRSPAAVAKTRARSARPTATEDHHRRRRRQPWLCSVDLAGSLSVISRTSVPPRIA
ncbi:MAG: Gfo/Idh/MocA family oxidoreductase [Gammaproteobacteria bacterium]|nr:Gfo/Idh/MocA family oxidoreductase [Gammaproteobacteria bacterium]